ncbi:HD domain-containing phosphohydrolase [Pseudanabaena galeata UHCC 0370]|uniref:HD domain-containing phosphohydrolase n=1 Tax=Pseudanabaena galeata UHCC 0370 TaxID=3110310 RepID=A0ABU5TGI8_9CYAN|nr:HD domain-containing phosphohydrolase [Pseudanabaena galeata]MEA5476758.1 HD domain-containing phosphohydrolase [Pseudanabaena galeata UHCC 0370]
MSYFALYEQLQELQQTLPAIADIIHRLDPETRQHSERLAIAAQQFGEYLALPKRDRQLLVWGAYIHDIGKSAIPLDILLKPAKLTVSEHQVIKEHTEIGESLCPLPDSMREVAQIIRHHHELWNGCGYPDRLMGEEIPYLVRIVQILDVYDALTHKRCYKRAYSSMEAIGILLIETTKGYYQPELIAEFMTFKEIEDHFGDRSSIVESMMHTNMSNRAMYDMEYTLNISEEIMAQSLQNWQHPFLCQSDAISIG